MNIIRTSFRYKCFRRGDLNGGFVNSVPWTSPKLFSTEADGAQLPQFSPDSLNQIPGVKYGLLTGSIRNALRSDVVNLLEGCDLSLEDVKTVYGPNFMPTSILVKFSSSNAYDKAMKLIMKERIYRLTRAEQSRWDRAKDYGGKTLLLEGIPRMAQQEEVERFLSGCEYDAAGMVMFTRQAFREPMKTCIVPVSSPIQANNVFLAKNRSYIANNQVLVRVLH